MVKQRPFFLGRFVCGVGGRAVARGDPEFGHFAVLQFFINLIDSAGHVQHHDLFAFAKGLTPRGAVEQTIRFCIAVQPGQGAEAAVGAAQFLTREDHALLAPDA